MARPRARRTGGAPAPRKARPPVEIGSGERRHLVEDCAFFRAQRHRDAAPGECREADLRSARHDIDGVIGRSRARRKP